MTTIIRGFTPHEKRLIERTLDQVDTRPMGLIIERASLDDCVLGMSDIGISGRPIVLLDLDQYSLPGDAICYLVAHEIAHVVAGHVRAYRVLDKKQVPPDLQRAVKDASEVAADQLVADWGFDWAIDTFKRAFPTDRLCDPTWAAGVMRRYDAALPAIKRATGIS